MINTQRVIGYTRVSTVRQTRGKSLDEQAANIEQYCVANGLELVGICSDAGVSGTKGREHREGYDKALSMLERGEVGGIIVDTLSRMGRQGGQTIVDITWIIEKLGCRFVALDLKVDLSGSLGVMMLSVMAAAAKLFRDQTSEKITDVLAYKRQNGDVYGPTPYGMTRDGDKLVPNPTEKAVIKGINQAHKRGQSLRAIAKGLNDRGIATKRGGAWVAATIKRIVERAA